MRTFASLGPNYRHPFCALAFLVIALCAGAGSGHAQNLERYTQVDASTVRRETGQLGNDGVLALLTSAESSLGVDEAFLAQMAPLNGRVIMDPTMFNALKTAGVIPDWVRSTRVYRLGISDYVIVCIQEVCDPNAPPPQPTLTRQPQSLSLIEGEPGVFSVEATGTAPLHYQWRKNGAAITGATSTNLVWAQALKSDSGKYDVVVTNAHGVATSLAATLTVTNLPHGTPWAWLKSFGLTGHPVIRGDWRMPPDASTGSWS